MTNALGSSLADQVFCPSTGGRWWIAQHPPSVLSRESVPDIRSEPSIPPGRPETTENAKNSGPDPCRWALPQPPPPRLLARSSLPERVGFYNMIPAPVRSVPKNGPAVFTVTYQYATGL